MASVRPLRELLADLVGDAGVRSDGPEDYLAEHGYPDLPAELVAQAVVSFADTAPPEVAEQLAPFVTAHTAGSENTADWFDLLTSAQADLTDDPGALDGAADEGLDGDFGPDPGVGLDFGAGAVDAIDFTVSLEEEAPEPAASADSPAAAEPGTVTFDTGDYLDDVAVDDEPDDEPDEDPLD